MESFDAFVCSNCGCGIFRHRVYKKIHLDFKKINCPFCGSEPSWVRLYADILSDKWLGDEE